MGFITCNLLGPGDEMHNYGLCNQMFQIAALYSHAKDNNLEVTFPQIKLPAFGGYDKNIFSKVNSQDIDYSTFLYLELPFGYHRLTSQDGIIYRGYMQSERYFLHNRSLILDLFTPTEEIRSYIESKYEALLKTNTLSIHVRRGDYINLSEHHPTVDVEYYTQAAKYITDITQIDNYVIFSDDIEYCKSLFGTLKEITYIEGEKDYIDLYLMSFCKHNIIVNSTFSWWGAWLNQNPNKIVVAPKRWFGPAKAELDTEDIIPKTWIKF
jgi:hypothetical protein